MSKIGSHIIDFDEVDSTNLYASRMIQHTPLKEGTVIRAQRQTAGIGQGNNKWFSEPNRNLTVSVILHPCFLPAEDQFLLNKAISLGVCDFVNSYRTGCRIKWPNDLYFEGRKIGGILIQNMISGGRMEISVAGIGVNINQSEFPPDLPNATSVRMILGHEVSLGEAFATLCECLENRYAPLRKGETAGLENGYLEFLYGIGEWRQFRKDSGEVFEGRIEGVNATGHLIIMDREQRWVPYDHKEVEYIL